MKGFGIISTYRAVRLLPAIALLTILGSCMTTRTTAGKNNFIPPSAPKAQTNNAPVGRFVPCAQDSIITFNAPDPDGKIAETAANVFDTPETISAVRKHNATHREACDK